MFAELDTIVLAHDIKEYGLREGDMGAIVNVYNEDETFEVEFVTGEGKTVALLTLTRSDIRPMKKNEILHVRGIASA
mgnify:CR=1 FL=1